MENKIQLLSSELINQIAAGEVVERPASIVKELMENAIDAKASEIILQLEKSGLDSITVIDNGSGMNSDEAATALLQHTTSKIHSQEDLVRISTLGFRGEALASISSIAETTIHSYDGKNPPVVATVREGKISTKAGEGRGQGSSITAARIFHNVPARRKFLKSEGTEFKYILETFTEIALAHPAIGFKLVRNGKESLNFPKSSSLEQRILQAFPNLKKEDMFPVFYDDPRFKITGFLGHPGLGSRTAVQQYLFINSRYIRNALINKAVKEGFGTALMREEQPLYLMFLQVSPELVDVNVHPRKLEVRFSDPGLVFSAVKRSVATALNKQLQQKFRENFEAEEQNVKVAPGSTSGPQKKYERPLKAGQGSIQQSLDFTKELLAVTRETGARTLTPAKTSANNLDLQEFKSTSTETEKEYSEITMPEATNSDFLQAFNTYIITFRNDKVLIIDQHAAHERVNFERISKLLEAEGDLPSQSLLIPERVTLTRSDVLTVKDNLEAYSRLGFKLGSFEDSALEISEMPVLLENKEPKAVFMEILEDIKKAEDKEAASRWREIKDKLISTLACHSSIRAGDRLNAVMVRKLITDLFKCDTPYSCPHGRPIVWELNKFQLEKNFKRKI